MQAIDSLLEHFYFALFTEQRKVVFVLRRLLLRPTTNKGDFVVDKRFIFVIHFGLLLQ